MRKPVISNLALLIAGASLGVTLPSVTLASPLEERLGGQRFEPSRERRAGRKGMFELAAKKKKKKKKAGHGGHGAAAGTSDKAGDDEESDATGAADEDVQKAARVTPAEGAASGADDAAAPRPPRGASKTEEEGAGAAGAERGPRGPLPRYLEVAIGGQAFARSLTYHQQVTTSLREYQPRLLGGAVASVVYYPAVHFTDGAAANIGLDLNIAQAFGISSRTPDGTSYPTEVHDYNGGVRVRVPIESTEPFLTLGYGNQAYKMTGANRAALILPDTDYKYLRAVVGLRMALPSSVSLIASGGYRYVLSAGGIKTDYFPNLVVGGMEATLSIGYALTNLIEARIGFDYRRYWYTMHSRTSDMYVVGGAIDQTYAGSLSLVATLGGPDRVAGGGAAEASPPAEDAPPPPRKKAKRPRMEGAEAPGAE